MGWIFALVTIPTLHAQPAPKGSSLCGAILEMLYSVSTGRGAHGKIRSFGFYDPYQSTGISHAMTQAMKAMMSEDQPEALKAAIDKIAASRAAKSALMALDRSIGSYSYRSRPGTSLRRFPKEHFVAFEFADLIRHLPELEFYVGATPRTTKPYDDMQEFLTKTPPGYHLIQDYTGPVVGLKYGLYERAESANESSPGLVLAFAPTQHLDDWLSNMNYAIDQISHPEITRLIDSIIANPKRPEKILITGHSLGGGLSQGFAYLLKKALISRALETGYNPKVEVVTFNAFGSQSQIEWIEGGLNPGIANSFEATHYFIKGDPVTPLGRHIGAPSSAIGNILDTTPSVNSISVGTDEVIGWRVHGVSPLRKKLSLFSNDQFAAELSPRLDQSDIVPGLRFAAPIGRPLLNMFRLARLELRAHSIAREVAKMRQEYMASVRQDRSPEGDPYLGWMDSEIIDLNTFFQINGDDEGMEILRPVLRELPPRP
jgi:hypothetical protein